MKGFGSKFSKLAIDDEVSLVTTARKGVGSAVFYSFAEQARLTEKDLAGLLHLHPRTISNYKSRKQALNPIEGEHLLKLIVLYKKGEELFGGIDNFNQWLQQPPAGAKEKSMHWLETPGGVDLIADELDRLTHGYVA